MVLPPTNMSPKNLRLEDEKTFGNGPFFWRNSFMSRGSSPQNFWSEAGKFRLKMLKPWMFFSKKTTQQPFLGVGFKYCLSSFPYLGK